MEAPFALMAYAHAAVDYSPAVAMRRSLCSGRLALTGDDFSAFPAGGSAAVSLANASPAGYLIIAPKLSASTSRWPRRCREVFEADADTLFGCLMRISHDNLSTAPKHVAPTLISFQAMFLIYFVELRA